VARFGGEEFVVLCEQTDEKGAMLLAERIREELAKTTFRTPNAAVDLGDLLGGRRTFPEAGRTGTGSSRRPTRRSTCRSARAAIGDRDDFHEHVHARAVGRGRTACTSAFNMLFLWIFGDNVEDALGHLRYLVFYLLGGVGAAAAQVLTDPGSTLPMVGRLGGDFGGAGGVRAALPAARRSPSPTFHYPSCGCFTVSSCSFLRGWSSGYFSSINLWDALMSPGTGGGGVAFMAHVGGFVAGCFCCASLWAGGRERTTTRGGSSGVGGASLAPGEPSVSR
jgi:hypothetical protein